MGLLKTSIAILFASTLMVGCGGKDKKTEDNKSAGSKTETGGSGSKLEGAWEIKRAEGDMPSMNVGTIYEFNGDKLIFSKDGFKNPGKTEIAGNTFSFQADGNEYKFMYEYHFNGDTLVVKMQGGSDQVFHMVKK